MSKAPDSPPTSPKRGKYLQCHVLMLDEQTIIFPMPPKSPGQLLMNEVAKKISLFELDYFDLEYQDSEGNMCWLDHEKPLYKQLPSNQLHFKFLVKFYKPDPGLLEDEFTRYLFALQIKRDLATGVLACQEHTAVLLASYIVQADLGDYTEDQYPDHTYLNHCKLLPKQTPDVQVKIMEHHKEHIGQSPAEADFNLLDTARKVEMYGIRLHAAKDHEGVPLHLAVAHLGILVFQNFTKINTFNWAKIRKLSFKRKKFLIKLHPEGCAGYYKDTVEFYFDSRNQSKNFWKKCIEHHSFFRCHHIKRQPRNKTRVMSRGSSFRYSGKTQQELVEFVREHYTKRAPFERKSTSMRTVSTMDNRSLALTPKSATLNSRDVNYGLNTSASSGSHTLEMDNIHSHIPDYSGGGQQQFSPQIHVNTNSFRGNNNQSSLDRRMVVGNGVYEHEQSKPQQQSSLDNSYHRQPPEHTGNGPTHYSPKMDRLDPSKFMLSPSDRKLSAPVFPVTDQYQHEYGLEEHMSRSPEIDNIPEKLQNNRELSPPSYDSVQPMHRTQSATQPEHKMYHQHNPSNLSPLMSRVDEEPLPPPPPPIYDEDQHAGNLSLSRSSGRRDVYDMSTASRTSTSAASRTLTSSVASSVTGDSEEEGRRKRYPADKAYYIAKELLMTERTYKKDLEVLTVWFRNAVTKHDLMPDHLMELLFGNLDPIYDFHCGFLKEIETRLHMWEGKSNAHLNGDYQKIGDIMVHGMRVLELYRNFLENQEELVNELELTTRRNREFEQIYKAFESQKVCYLPLNTFLLKPAQRLMHYKLILERLLTHYDDTHPDFGDCQMAFSIINDTITPFKDRMSQIENLQKLIELQRDLVGIDSVVVSNRFFIREGCLQKLSRKGYQQRMFFLFSDLLIYTSRTAPQNLQFKVHGQLQLKGMSVEEADEKMAVANSFAIYSNSRCLLVAAATAEEKDKWMEDLQLAIDSANRGGDVTKIQYPSLKSNSSSECLDDSHEDASVPPSSPDRQHRANTTMHVCWHRNTSVSMRDHILAVENQLSGYLLRKFKNSNGWQKLWVVFTNFCLFFYKTYQDDFHLASLPLLGYSVTTPADGDNIHKDYVFKLQFKNHVYFFRAESEYTFERWIEVISSATSTTRRTRLFSRLESSQIKSYNH